MNPAPPARDGQPSASPTMVAPPTDQKQHPSTHVSDLEASGPSRSVQTSAVPPDRTAASNRYVLTAFHARGGMGEVWRCHDSSIGREVALKRLTPSRATARERFLCEAQVTGQLEHPGIVPVHDLGFDDNGQPFYVMKLVRGRTLKSAIDEFHAPPDFVSGDESLSAQPDKTVRPPRAVARTRLLKTFLDLCHAVAYAHSRGVIHRDLKPDNVMLGPFGETVVLDWGLAKLKNQTGPEPSGIPSSDPTKSAPALSGVSAQTEDGSILGSPLYMPPEMAEGHNADADQRTDVYLLGATLYEILAGRPPRQGATRDELLELARTTPPVPPHKLVKDVPRALEAICQKAMSRSRGHRYGTALALADDIQRYLAGEPVLAYHEPLWMRVLRFIRRHQRILSRISIAVIIVACVLIGFFAYRRASELQAREHARSEIKKIRSVIDEASFYAASTDAPGEVALYYSPTRARQLGDQALDASAQFGTDLAQLPLVEERVPVRRELDALNGLLAVQSRSASPTTAPTRAHDLFLQGERVRLANPSSFALSDPRGVAAQDRLRRAMSFYQQALSEEPGNYWARFQLARCFMALGRLPESIESFSACIALRPEAPWGYASRALALGLSRRFDEAHRDLDRALAVAPDSLPARLNRGVLFRLQNDPTRAAAEFDALLSRPSPPPEAAYYRAQLFLRSDQPHDALELMNRTLRDFPQFQAGYLLRAQALLALNQPNEALNDLDRLAPEGTTAVDAAANRGHLLRHITPQLPRKHQKAAYTLAQQQLSAALATAPIPEAYSDLGAVLHRIGRYDDAVAAFTRANALDPRDPQLLINRGWSYESLGRLPQANADFTAALRLAPDSAEAHAGLGYVESRLKHPVEAQRGASLALLNGTRDYLVLHNVGCIYAQLAKLDPASARAQEDAAITVFGRAVDAWGTSVAGINERELIHNEIVSGVISPSLAARPEMQAMLKP